VEWNIMGIEDEYLDVLQNIEFAILTEYRSDRSALAMPACNTIAARIGYYEPEVRQRNPPQLRISQTSRKIFDAVKEVCEFRLGRIAVEEDPPEPISPDEVVTCLKRIRKSIERWTKSGGRQGYLSFVSQYIL